ncbi:hypothetical protein ACFPYI_16395 [Halomarina salina]|uniref:Uncharacterized protein n=1 Tax=Halomarina salina TaxID=1872699 RepID=A0ABD5RR16_9EURY|nr:hypothetical protein [Halomarina salina]
MSDDADSPDALVALVRALGPHCDAAYALLERPPTAVDEPGVPNPQAVWSDVESAFVPTWTGWTNENSQRRWHRTELPDHLDDLAALADLTRTGVGQWFLHTLALARDDEWVLVAVPHSRFVALSNASRVRAAASDALAPYYAALVDGEETLSWTDGDRTLTIRNGSICVDGDGSGHCWPLSRVEAVERVGERTVRLGWADRSHGPVRRAVGRLLRTPNPPERVVVPDEETRDTVADAIESFRASYEPS